MKTVNNVKIFPSFLFVVFVTVLDIVYYGEGDVRVQFSGIQ